MTILDQIIAHKRREVASLSLGPAPANLRPPRGFARLVGSHPVRPAIIAEIKRASPSKGEIALKIDPVNIASQYLKNGAAGLSILTDTEFFKGSNSDLQAVRAEFPEAPILRKEFIVDAIQVEETLRLGADAILLILAVLDDAAAEDLAGAAWQAGLDVLFEVHNESEVDRLLPILKRAPAPDRCLFGVNNRDLKTFEVDISTTARCIARLQAAGSSAVVRVGESGIKTRADIDRLAAGGADAFLIGETLIRTADPGKELAKLLGRG